MAISKEDFKQHLQESLKDELIKLEKKIDSYIKNYKTSTESPIIKIQVTEFSVAAIRVICDKYPSWNIKLDFIPAIDQRDTDEYYLIFT